MPYPALKPVRRTCAHCRKVFILKGQRLSQVLSDARRGVKGHKGRFCALPCLRAWNASLSPYRDDRHREREAKRRERARLHARGLTSKRTKYECSPALLAHAMSRYVAPETKGPA